MTQEEKQLLLKDLCGRLPYEPHIYIKAGKAYADIVLNGTHIHDWMTVPSCQNITIKPYLRPLKSMTTDEKMEWFQMRQSHCNMSGFNELQERADFTSESTDWLNVHHFDYRGLIPMGLALKAPEGMYNE